MLCLKACSSKLHIPTHKNVMVRWVNLNNEIQRLLLLNIPRQRWIIAINKGTEAYVCSGTIFGSNTSLCSFACDYEVVIGDTELSKFLVTNP